MLISPISSGKTAVRIEAKLWKGLDMNISYCKNHERMSDKAASLVMDEIKKKKNLILCAATGNSPKGLYHKLITCSKKQKGLFEQVIILKLDEWGGIPENHPATCESYLRTSLLDPLGISSARYISFHSNPLEPSAECARVQSELNNKGPIDVCILGLGSNGHIGFIEPGPFLEPHCHVAHLSEKSLQHSMVQSLESKPAFGLTLGIRDILNSRKIILLISGEKKEKVSKAFLSGKISTALPASLLWLHGNVDCFIDKSMYS